MISFHIHGQEFDLAFPPCPLARWPLIRRDHFVSRATCASICQPMKRPESPPPRRGTTRSPAGSTYASLGVSHAGVVHSLTVLPTNALLSCATNTCSGVRPECHVFFRMQVVVSPPVAQRRSDRLLCMVPYTKSHSYQNYHHTQPACLPWQYCRHYLQNVWENTTHVGCAIYACPMGTLGMSSPWTLVRQCMLTRGIHGA